MRPQQVLVPINNKDEMLQQQQHDRDDSPHNVDKDDDQSLCSNDSVDTNEALMEMLGLTSDAWLLTNVMDDDKEEQEEEPSKEAANNRIHTMIDLPKRCSRYLYEDCLAFFVDHVLTKRECQQVIQMANGNNFRYITSATHTAPDGTSYEVQLQNPNPHQLSVFYNQKVLSKLWSLIQNILPARYPTRLQKYGSPLGLNPKLRVLKYDANHNDHFQAHFDATTVVDGTTSLLTVLLYLNDGDNKDFDGGETLYLNHYTSGRRESSSTKITPRAGRVVLFEHDLYHCGAPLTWGTKYVLRTDVMFDTTKAATTKQKDKPPNKKANNDSQIMQKDNEEMTTQQKPMITIQYLCQEELSLSLEDMQNLENMDLLDMTIESFVSPGPTVLKHMLLDSGMEADTVQRLVHAAVAHFQN